MYDCNHLCYVFHSYMHSKYAPGHVYNQAQMLQKLKIHLHIAQEKVFQPDLFRISFVDSSFISKHA
jgi:hypothetical protein